MLGLKLESLGDPLVKYNFYIPQFSKENDSTIDLKIHNFLSKGVLTKCDNETDEYSSPIFIR